MRSLSDVVEVDEQRLAECEAEADVVRRRHSSRPGIAVRKMRANFGQPDKLLLNDRHRGVVAVRDINMVIRGIDGDEA